VGRKGEETKKRIEHPHKDQLQSSKHEILWSILERKSEKKGTAWKGETPTAQKNKNLERKKRKGKRKLTIDDASPK